VDYGKEKFILGEWQVDPYHNVIIKKSDSDKIEKRLIRVLVVLANNSQKSVTKEQLLHEVWQGKVVSDETISVAISKLRKALGCNAKKPRYIETITGVGFRLLVQPEAIDLLIEPADNVRINVIEPGKSNNKANTRPWYKSSVNYAPMLILLLMIIIYQSLTSPVPPTEQLSEKIQLVNDESYAKALFLMQQDIIAVRQAETLLNRLYQQKPNNSLILTALGKAKYFQYWYVDKAQRAQLINSAKSLFKQALSINPDLGDAYLQLAMISMEQERNFTLADEYFIQSIVLDPEQVITHIQYANMLLSQRRFKEAIHHNKIAQSIDPDYYSSASIEWIYNMAEQYELAEKELAKLFTIDPESATYTISALRLFENMGDEDRAYFHYNKAFMQAGYSPKEIAITKRNFEQGGLKQLNYWLANIKKEQLNIGQYLPPVSTARYHVAAGEYDKALTLLEQANTEHNNLSLWFNSDPKYAPLRELPRFIELIKNIEKTIK